MKYKLFILFLILPTALFSQEKLDSLQKVLIQTTNKSQKIKILRELSITSYRSKNVAMAKQYCIQGIQLAQKTKNLSQEASMTSLLARIYRADNSYKNAELNLKKTIALYEKINDIKNLVKSNSALGGFYLERGDRLKALKYNVIASKKLENLLNRNPSDKNLLSQKASIYTSLGLIALGQKEYQKSEGYFDKTAKIGKKIDDKMAIVRAYINWGVCLKQQNKDAQAIPLYEEAYKLGLELNHKVVQAMALNNLGTIYNAEKNYDKALEYYQKSLELKEKNGEEDVLPYTLNNIASIYTVKGNYDKAEKYYQRSLEIAHRTQERDKEAATLLGIAEFYETKSDFENAFEYFKKYTTLNDSLNNISKNKQVIEIEAKYENEKKEQENKLLRNQTLLQQSTIEAQILKEDQLELEKEKQAKENKIKSYIIKQKGLQEEKLKAQSDKRKKENEILKKTQELKDAKLSAQNAQISQQYTTIMAITVGLSLFFILAGILYRSNRQKRRANLVLEEQKRQVQIKNEEVQVQNEELLQQQEEIISQRDYIETQNKDLARQNNFINSSINAALTIQNAILPFRERIEKFFPKHFILFKAKDTVSGDFYWIEKVENYSFAVVADCTGHGVSGAFMAMIGHTLLDRIITFEKTYEPAKILDRLHEETQRVLRQKTTGNNNGMDIIVLRVEQKADRNEMIFAGAKRPLYYWDTTSNQIETLKPTRKSIGGIQNKDIDFVQKRVMLEKDSTLYLCSDGYIDQNDINRKRFGVDKFKNLLQKIHADSLEKQKNILTAELNIHMKHTHQRDDILVLGIKV